MSHNGYVYLMSLFPPKRAAIKVNSLSCSQQHVGIKKYGYIPSRNSTSGYISEENEIPMSKISLHPLFIAALFTLAKTWKQSNCPLMDG